jgi:hypothetical protein
VRVVDEDEWDDDGEGREEDEQQDADRAAPVLAGEARAFSRRQKLLRVLADAVEVGGLQRLGDLWRQGLGEEPARLRRIGGLLDAAQERRVAAGFGEAGDEVKRGIDVTPREIAADGADQHRMHVFPADLRDAERAGKREHHDEAEDDFRKAFERIEYAVAGWSQAHGLMAPSFWKSSIASASIVTRSIAGR